jgi:hypothetical protein
MCNVTNIWDSLSTGIPIKTLHIETQNTFTLCINPCVIRGAKRNVEDP